MQSSSRAVLSALDIFYAHILKNRNYPSTAMPILLMIAILAQVNTKQRSWLLFALVAIFWGSGALLLLWTNQLEEQQTVHKIKVGKLSYLSNDELLALSKLEVGKRYSLHDLRQLSSLLEAHPIILEASVRQKKDTIYMNLKERECLALVEDKGKSIVHDIDVSGNILSHDETRCKNVPLLLGVFNKEVIKQSKGAGLAKFAGEQMQRLLANLLLIRKNYPDMYARISEVRIDVASNLTIFLLHSRMRIELPSDLNIQIVRKLYATVAWLLSEKTKDAWIDLRGPEAILHTNL